MHIGTNDYTRRRYIEMEWSYLRHSHTEYIITGGNVKGIMFSIRRYYTNANGCVQLPFKQQFSEKELTRRAETKHVNLRKNDRR